jgi:SAM-dependent methyltransferase
MREKFQVFPTVKYDFTSRYNVLQCRKCGYLAASPIPDSAVLQNVYNTDFHSTPQQAVPLGPDGRLLPESYTSAVYKNAQRRVQMLQRFRSSGTLLDIGCGKGLFCHAASAYYRVVGVDLAQHAVDWGRTLGLDLLCGDFQTMDFGTRRFDIITMWDLLACIPDPLPTMEGVVSLLNPKGLVAVTFPDGGSLACRLLRSYWPMMIPPINLGFHTHKSIATMAEKTGLRLQRYSYLGKLINISFLLLKLKRTLRLRDDKEGKRELGKGRSVFLNLRDIATVILEKS